MSLTPEQQTGRERLQERGKNKVIGWEMTPEEAQTFFKSQNKVILTFLGYSGMQYENFENMLNVADRLLFHYSPETTIINIGATQVGIGLIYAMAKSRGFTTTGITSTVALEYPDDISESVDFLCFIKDTQWGGKLPNSTELSPTSKAMVLCSDTLVGIGGGEIARDELLYGKELGKIVYFYPAESNYERTIHRATQMGKAKPESFWGAAHEVFENYGQHDDEPKG
ncbi:MAG: hypothetical protein U0Z26_01325 [Anaerolineales bacterium]